MEDIILSVVSLAIEPETSKIEDKVVLTLELSHPSLLSWTLTYVVDSAGSKKTIELNKITENSQSLRIETPEKINLDHIPRHFLLNIGLFRLEAVDAKGQVVIQKNMLVHVSRDKADE